MAQRRIRSLHAIAKTPCVLVGNVQAIAFFWVKVLALRPLLSLTKAIASL
ncbi:MAG: hypothetical protein KME31_21185 [Tolypothrix carrinoi HA7290-LM1]|nr:hypothetical protein [Tolypothrix carrinoi HA7290-LM1]